MLDNSERLAFIGEYVERGAVAFSRWRTERGIGHRSFEAVLEARMSCRSFLPAPIPEETIREIVTMAGRAPSWSNTQAWHVTVTRGQLHRQLAAAVYEAASNRATTPPDVEFPKGYHGIFQDRRRGVGYALYERLGIRRRDIEARRRQVLENYRFFGAPHAAILTAPRELGAYGILDCGGFLSQFCLAAEARGVATCAQGAIAEHCDLIRGMLDIPEDRMVVCAIAFGRPDRTHPANGLRADRAPLDEILTLKG